MENFFQILGKIAGIAGITVGTLLIIFREIIRKAIFPTLTKEQAYKTLRLIILLTFIIASVGLTFWFIPQLFGNKQKPVKLINDTDTLTINNSPDSGEFEIVQTSAKSLLKIVDIYYDPAKKVFDLKVQNNSNNTIFLKAVQFSIKHESSTKNLNADPSGLITFGADKEQLRNALMMDKTYEHSQTKKVSFKIPPHDVDRYLLSFDVDLLELYRDIKFIRALRSIPEENVLCSIIFSLYYNQEDILSVRGSFLNGFYFFDVASE